MTNGRAVFTDQWLSEMRERAGAIHGKAPGILSTAASREDFVAEVLADMSDAQVSWLSWRGVVLRGWERAEA